MQRVQAETLRNSWLRSPLPPSSFVLEFVSLIDAFGLAIGTFAFQTFRRKLWLLGKKIINQSLAHLGMRENLAALFAC
jgi:hypothetical protein